MEVGILELNRNPANYFAEVEQSAFNPANIVPGIGFSPDKVLQGRLFSYGDTQRYRLGVNHGLLQVNAPRCPYSTAHRDGLMRTGNLGGVAGDGFPPYQPDSFGGIEDSPALGEKPLPLEGSAGRWDHRVDADYYSQPRALFNLMTKEQQDALCGNIARSLGKAKLEIQLRQMELFKLVDAKLASGVTATMKGPGKL